MNSSLVCPYMDRTEIVVCVCACVRVYVTGILTSLLHSRLQLTALSSVQSNERFHDHQLLSSLARTHLLFVYA